MVANQTLATRVVKTDTCHVTVQKAPPQEDGTLMAVEEGVVEVEGVVEEEKIMMMILDLCFEYNSCNLHHLFRKFFPFEKESNTIASSAVSYLTLDSGISHPPPPTC